MSNEIANEQHATQSLAVIRELQAELKSHIDAATESKKELEKYKKVIKYIKEEVIPPNYPYRSNCSSPFCKFITALRMHGLD